MPQLFITLLTLVPAVLVLLVALVPVVLLAAALLFWIVGLWPLALVLAGYALVWAVSAIGRFRQAGSSALTWGAFLFRYLLMVALPTLIAFIRPGGRWLDWLKWVAVFAAAIFLRDRFGTAAAIAVIAAYVALVSWPVFAIQRRARLEAKPSGFNDLPEAAAALLQLAGRRSFAWAPVLDAAAVGVSLLPYLDALSEWPAGLREVVAFVLAIFTGALVRSIANAAAAGSPESFLTSALGQRPR